MVLAQLAPGATPVPSQSGIRQDGAYMTAPILLDGATLFRIAGPVTPQPGQTAITARQLAVENALATLVAVYGSDDKTRTLYNPRTLAVYVVPSNNGQAIVEAGDGAHPSVRIVTATPIDAKYNGLTITSVADRWQGILQTALRNALLKRQPGVERRNEIQAAIAAAVLLVLTFLVLAAGVFPIQRRLHAIEQRLAARSASSQNGTEPQRRRRFMALALRASDPQRRVDIMHAIAAMLVWLLAVLWFAALVWGFSLFPGTTPLAHQVSRTVLKVVATWILAGLVNRLLDLSIARIAGLFRHRHHLSAEERARELLRIPTFTKALTGFKTALIYFVALLVTLSETGIPVWSVVTFGGLAAIGITLAAQNFVRDFVNGFLVLFEDQYVAGDYITINGQSGIVENLTLRVAQIRDTSGNLVTIPHSSVTSVINHSRNWSRVDYRVSIDPAADGAKALDLVRDSIEKIAQDEQWRGFVLEPIEWIGVESLSRDGIIIRASMKTAPLRQFELRRAINERVRRAFVAAGIRFGAPMPALEPPL
jgi:small conductance mechanosensitive channel